MNDFYDGYGADQNWRQPNRNGITADGGYDPQFDFEDRAYPITSGYNRGPLDSSEYQSDGRMQTVQYRPESSDRVQRQESSSGDWSDNQLAAYRSLVNVTNNLDQRSLKEFDPNIDPDVGCAKAVSLAISQAYGVNVNEVNVNRLEGRLRGLGFQEVNSTRDIKPGDVILGYRPNNDFSHAAVYMGNGMIFNNDSETQLMRQQSINKFNSAEFNKFVVLRRPDVPLGASSSSGQESQAPVRRSEQPPVRRVEQPQGPSSGSVPVRRDSSNRVKW